MPTIAEARQTFTDLLGRAHYKGERIEITRRQTPYASIVSVEDKARLEELEKIRRKWGFSTIDELLGRLREMKTAK